MAGGFLVWDANHKSGDGATIGRWIECFADSLGKLTLSPDSKVQIEGTPTVNIGSVSGVAGGQKYLFTSDISKVFEEMLTEQKITNAYLGEMMDEHLTEEDLEEEE